MNVQMNVIFERISSRDKDFRYMALSDLSQELGKPTFNFDSPKVEESITVAVLNQLYDQTSDVNSLATKCLGLLGGKASQECLRSLSSSLVSSLTRKKQAHERDAAALGLRTLVDNIPESYAPNIAAKITESLLEGLKSDVAGVGSNCMDIIAELLGKFGLVVPDPGSLQAALLRELELGRSGIRKRAVQCIGYLAASVKEDSSFNVLVDEIQTRFKNSRDCAQSATLVQAMANLARASGGRMSNHVEAIVPLVLQKLEEAAAAEEQEDLMEVCLMALEVFVQRCPEAMGRHIPNLIDVVEKYIKYDPNVVVSDDEGDRSEECDDMGIDEQDEADQSFENEEEEEEDVYSDEEDSSWKVRRASAKLASAIILHYQSSLKETYRRLHKVLLSRSTEREEAVRPMIYGAYMHLVDSMAMASRGGDVEAASALESDAPKALRSLSRQLKSHSVKTKSLVLQCMQKMAIAAPSSVGNNLECTVSGVSSALQDASLSSSTLKMDALQFLYTLSSSKDRNMSLQEYMAKLAPLVFRAITDRYYSVSAQALRVSERFVYVIRPVCPGPISPNMETLVTPLVESAVGRLKAVDQSQEVKEAAIVCVAAAISWLGDQVESTVAQVGALAEEFAGMPDKGGTKNSRARKRAKNESGDAVASSSKLIASNVIIEVITLLENRLGNENTRLPAVRAFRTIAQSPLPLDLSCMNPTIVMELSGFLRKSNRSLRFASLEALSAIVTRGGLEIGSTALESVISEAANLVNDSDLVLATKSLRLAINAMRCHPDTVPVVKKHFLPPAVALIESPLLQEQVLEALRGLLKCIAEAGQDPEELMFLDFGASVHVPLSSVVAAAQWNAVVCSTAGPSLIDAETRKLLKLLADLKSSDDKKGIAQLRFAILCLGELGRIAGSRDFPQLPEALTEALSNENAAEAASLALGALSSGNVEKYLPMLLDHLKSLKNKKHQYHLLRALKEAIATVVNSSFSTQTNPSSSVSITSEQVDDVLALFFKEEIVQDSEECRTVISECLGMLLLVHPNQVIDILKQRITPEWPTEVRCMAITAFRHATSEQFHPISDALAMVLPQVLTTYLVDDNLDVKATTIRLLSYAGNYKKKLITPYLPEIFPILIRLTERDPGLVRVINLGPFKHKVDDGLKIRKASFECLGVLMSRCYSFIDPNILFNALLRGLRDEYDVKIRCHGLMADLSCFAPGVVMAHLDQLVEPLTATLTARLKSDAVTQEIDRNKDLQRSCLRAVAALASLPGAMDNPAFKAFMDQTVKAEDMKQRYEEIEAERMSTEAIIASVDGHASRQGFEFMDTSL